MKRFTRLFLELDASTGTLDKVDALKRYFREAPPEDAAWALAVLSGNKLMRAINSRRLRQWASEESGLPPWLISECYGVVGDLSETLALVLPKPQADASDEPLHRVVTQRLLPLEHMSESQQRASVTDSWRQFNRDQRFLFHKLLSATFRVGVSAKLVSRALAEVAEIDPAVMAHRLMGAWRPTADNYRALLASENDADRRNQPYPFYLASPIAEAPDGGPAGLGDADGWAFEWKWDGIRAQLIRRDGEVFIWSRGEELVTHTFPEIAAAAGQLGRDVVLDGEVLAWEDGRPLPFSLLQRRLNRKRVEMSLFPEAPIAMVVYDLLEWEGRDVRGEAIEQRWAMLEEATAGETLLIPSERVSVSNWDEAQSLVAGARDRGVEGLMVKRLGSAYGVGRKRGDWWKWKVDPLSVDAVMVQAQTGSGKRAGLFTDYTFGVWDNGELVPVAKAYSGLTHEEIEQVDRWVRNNTVQRHGPVRAVRPELVFELHFEAIAASKRHKSGIAVRFPRMARWRRDKPIQEADTLESMKAMLARYGR